MNNQGMDYYIDAGKRSVAWQTLIRFLPHRRESSIMLLPEYSPVEHRQPSSCRKNNLKTVVR